MESDSLTHTLPSWFEWDPEPKAETTTSPPDQDELAFNAFPEDDSNLQYLDETYIEQHRDEIRRKPKESIVKPFVRTGPDNRLPSFAELSFVVTPDAFERGSLRLTCIATLYNLYAGRSELVFDMEQPEVASVLGVRNSSPGLWRCIDGAIVVMISIFVIISYR